MPAQKRLSRFSLALALLALLLGPSPAAAQNPSWDTLKQLAPGQQIRVVLNDSKSHKGQFQAITEDAIVIHSKGADQTIPRQSVKLISSKRPSHRGRHALIGGAIGAGVGLSSGGPIATNCFCTANQVRAVATPLFGVLGAAIGAALPSGGWQELYRSNSN
jgi:hypothetical protein